MHSLKNFKQKSKYPQAIILFLQNKYLLLSLLLSFIGLYPLTHTGLHPTHDGEYHIIRFYEFYRSFSEGNIYPRWASDLNAGFGVPLFNYVYPLPNYIASVLHVLGFSFIDAFKLNMMLATLIGCLFFFYFTRYFFDDLIALVGAVFYSFAPYRFVDIYVRGSVGEVWALAFLPGILFFLLKSTRDNRKFIIPGGIIFSLLIFSHNILAMLSSIFIACYGTVLILEQKQKLRSCITVLFFFLIGLSISAIFWLPALGETSYVKGLEIYDVRQSFVEAYQLLFPSWGTGFSSKDSGNEMSLQIGFIHTVITVFCIFLFFLKRRSGKERLTIIFMILTLNFSIYMMLSTSSFIWESVPLLGFVQFPWRILSIVIFTTSFLAAYSLTFFSSKQKTIVSYIYILLLILTTISYTKPAYYHMRDDGYYIRRPNFIRGTNSIGNLFNTIWIDEIPRNKKKEITFSAKGLVLNSVEKTQQKTYTVYLEQSGDITFPIAYFPGWSIYVDRTRYPTQITTDGLVKTHIPAGKHSIEVVFLDTIIRKIAKSWTLITILFLTIITFKLFVLKKNERSN